MAGLSTDVPLLGLDGRLRQPALQDGLKPKVNIATRRLACNVRDIVSLLAATFSQLRARRAGLDAVAVHPRHIIACRPIVAAA